MPIEWKYEIIVLVVIVGMGILYQFVVENETFTVTDTVDEIV